MRVSTRLPNDQEKAIARIFMQAETLLSNSSPWREKFSKAAIARLCTKPGVPDEAALLERAHAIIEAAGE